MKTYKDITKRYLFENRGRTITTICGIILSISLITAIMFFVKGIHQSFIDREINASGEYHIAFTGLSKDELSKMSAHPGVKNVGLFNNLGLIVANNGEYDYKFSLNEVTSGEEHLFPYDILEGRFGKDESEIVVDKITIKEMRKFIGDNVTIEANGKKSNYKIVGIIDNEALNEAKKEGSIIISKSNVSLGAETLVAFEGHLKGLRKTLNELQVMTTKEGNENRYYLSYIGAGKDIKRNAAIVSMAIIIISLVIVSTVLVIKNSFYISIVSRLKEFGLLKAIGATTKQLRSMIIKEANIIALISIPFGLFFGTIAIIVVEKVLWMMSEQTLVNIKIEWWILAIAAILGFITTYICAFLPTLELKKISSLEAIDNRNGIKKENIKRRKYSFIEKFFNIRTVIAYRNIKRNKRRYNSTILGLTISMIIFIVFSSYMGIVINNTLGYTEASLDVPDITTYVYNNEKSKVDSLLNELHKIKGISIFEKNSLGTGFLMQIIKKYNLNKEIFNEDNNYMSRRELNKDYDIIAPTIYSINLNDDIMSILDKYVIEGKVNSEYMKKNNGIILVNERLHYLDNKYRGRFSNLKVGDKVYLDNYENIKFDESGNIKEYKKEGIKEFEVVAIVSELPKGLEEYDYVVHNDSLKELLGHSYNEYLKPDSIQIRIKDYNNKESIRNNIKNIFEKYSINYYDEKEAMKQSNEFINQIKFLVYGFIIVLGLISCTNIFNTMSTNIIFRRREIASLRAIGMSKKEIRNMIMKEGALYGIISLIYATIIGTIINFMLYRNLITITNFKFVIQFDVILFIGIIGTLVGIIASLIPLRKVDHASIVEDLKSE